MSEYTIITTSDYKSRFIVEYRELEERRTKLNALLRKWCCGELDFEPSCSKDLLMRQLNAMTSYLSILCERADIEGIDLTVHGENVGRTDGEGDCMGGTLFDTPEEATEAWNTRAERTCKPFTRQRQPCSNCGAFVSLDAATDCIATLPVRHCPWCGAKVVAP